MRLWEQCEVRAWERALAGYDARIEHRETARLPELDRWYRSELPGLLASRPKPYLKLAELVNVTSWKMKRGTYRARNLVLVKQNAEADVRALSRQAFEAVPDLRKPIAHLATLSGVGPATASAVLAAWRPDLFPFFDEEVAQQIPSLGKVAFTASYYFRYGDALRARAAELHKHSPRDGWTAHTAAQALWAVSGR